MTDIDDFMSEDPLILANSPEKLKKVIAYLRQQRADFESGVKPKKADKDSKAAELIAKLQISGAIQKQVEKRRA